MKRCSRCRTEKPRGEFDRNRAEPDGRFHYCRLCHKEYRRELVQRGRFTHGRVSSYSNGCRCTDCREASTRARRKYRGKDPDAPYAPRGKEGQRPPELPSFRTWAGRA